MKHLLVWATTLLLATTASAQFSKPPKDPPLSLGITHILPSALPIPAGVMVLGTTTGAGFFDVFDITTNLYLDLIQVFNVSAKVNLYKSDIWAAALFGSFYSQTVKQLVTVSGVTNQQSIASTSMTPGAVFSYRMRRHFTGHAGVEYNIRNPAVDKNLLPARTALVQGTVLFKEFAYGVNPNFAIAAGGSYDLTYDVWGAGLTFHIGNFQLGAHYYLNVSEGAIMPIVGGGYSTKLD